MARVAGAVIFLPLLRLDQRPKKVCRSSSMWATRSCFLSLYSHAHMHTHTHIHTTHHAHSHTLAHTHTRMHTHTHTHTHATHTKHIATHPNTQTWHTCTLIYFFLGLFLKPSPLRTRGPSTTLPCEPPLLPSSSHTPPPLLLLI